MAEPWAPTLVDVGNRVPTKTMDQTTPGSTTLKNTFDDTTVPTAAQVQPILDGAIATVRSAVGVLGSGLYALAKDAAAWRAAADLELAYPDRPADVATVYAALNERAKTALQRLVDAADDAGVGAEAQMPVWSMPTPVPWGDQYL